MKMKRFEPKNKCVMVLRDESHGEQKLSSGLYAPSRAVELANEGIVRAAEEGGQYSVDDRVVFTKYSGSEFKLNGVTYILLPEKDIQGVVHETDVDMPDELVVEEAAATFNGPLAANPELESATQAALAQLAKQGENK